MPCVFQPTNGRETSIILPIQVEKLSPVTRDIQAMGVAYDCGIEAFHNGCNVRLDRVGYPSCGGASLHVASLGIGASRLLRALYLNQLAPIKHDGLIVPHYSMSPKSLNLLKRGH